LDGHSRCSVSSLSPKRKQGHGMAKNPRLRFRQKGR
jgi:hypothetical protein